jgi:type I restriction enzyme, S subunit
MSKWKDTDFGKVPVDWEISTLGQICELLTDGSHLSPKPLESEYFMASVKDMRYDHFDFSNCKTISKHDFDKLIKNNCQPQYGDILLSKDGANCLDIIFVYKQAEQIVLLSSIAIARLKKEYKPDFYRYFLLSPNVQDLMRNNFVSGSAIPRVILKDFRNVPITVLDYATQTEIAEVLSSLDDKIDLLHRQNKTTEKLAETLFRQWFIEDGQKNDFVELGEYAETINGVSYKSSELNPSTKAMVSLKSFDRNGGFRIDGFKEFTGKYKEKQVVVEGDLIVAHTDITQEAEVIGNPALVFGNPKYDTLVISMDIVKVVPKVEWISIEFLYYLMKTREFKGHCEGNANGSTVLHLSKQAIPTFEFTNHAKELTKKIFNNHNQIRTLTQLRDSLLPKLMSGEIRVDS